MLPYKSCKGCRDRVKKYQHIVTIKEDDERLPMNTHDAYWLFERGNGKSSTDTGKWMLFCPNDTMNDKWKSIKQMCKDGKIKCSTGKENPRSSCSKSGIIILYSYHSADEEWITTVGNNSLATLYYHECPYMYYKTDEQTFQGTRATGCNKNYTYRLKTRDE